MSRLQNIQLRIMAFLVCACVNQLSVTAQNNCQMLCNSDFENTKIVSSNSYTMVDQSKVPCWETTASDKIIEVWGSNFLGAPAYSGNQFIELNANMVSTLYQNFTAVLSSTIQLSFAHRGRSGTDVLSVEIGPVGGPYHNFGNFSANNTKWSYHTVTYTFPATGSKNYTLRFNSVSAAGGSQGVGNLLDAITVSLPSPEITANVIQPQCSSSADGSIALNVSGGNSPFSYKWSAPLNKTSASVSNLQTGNYHVDIIDVYGCTTQKEYVLFSDNKEFNDILDVVACDSFYWPVTKLMYKKSGQYVSSFATHSGCDSNFTLNLNLGISTRIADTAIACDSYYWQAGNITYTESGVYTRKSKTKYGCDSVLQLHLTINHSYKTEVKFKSKQPYIWPENGVEYTETGVYEMYYQTSSECDSIFVLKYVLDKEDSVFIPNAFSPDGNNINDTWGPSGNNIDWYQSEIYDQWGGQVWLGNQNQRFEGLVAYKELPQGVFAYYVTIMNKESEVKRYKGTLTLLR